MIDSRLRSREKHAPVNRSAILGATIATLGLFFMPILQIKPDLINTGVSVQLLEIGGDLRYVTYFVLTLLPLMVAFDEKQEKRTGLLVGLGALMLIGALLMPAIYAQQILSTLDTPPDATEEQVAQFQQAREEFFNYLPAEKLKFSNPRALPTGGILAAFLGGYIVLFAGIRDLEKSGQSRGVILFATALVPVVLIYLFVDKHLESYSVIEEYRARGAEVQVFFFEHLSYVLVAILAGLVIGIGQGLWAARDERMAPVILYSVGIIQTIPSLALFGLLLVPLAGLGNQKLPDILPTLLALGVVAAFFVGILLLFGRLKGQLEYYGRTGIVAGQQLGVLITSITAIAVALPLGLLSIILIGFSFRIVRISLIDAHFSQTNTLLMALVVLIGLIWAGKSRVRGKGSRKRLGHLRMVLVLFFILTLGNLVADAASVQLQRIDLSRHLVLSFDKIPVARSFIGSVSLSMGWMEPLFWMVAAVTVIALLGLSGFLERMTRYVLYVNEKQKRRDTILYGLIAAIFVWLSTQLRGESSGFRATLDSLQLSPHIVMAFTIVVVMLFLFTLVNFIAAKVKEDRVERLAELTISHMKIIRRYFSLAMLIALSLLILIGIIAFTVTYKNATVRDMGVSGIGVAPAIIALTLYSLLPLVRNTYAGLQNVDPAIIDAGQGVGMTPAQIFFQIELPLAMPVIIAGVRNAVVALVGIATIAAIIGGGGLGETVLQGIDNATIDQILLGTIPAVILAFGLDWLVRVVEILITSPGIRQLQN